MKALFFTLTMLPLFSFAQLGIKAGYITDGYQAGLAYHIKLNNGESGFFEIEALYTNRGRIETVIKRDRLGRPVTDDNGLILGEEARVARHYVQLPLTVKIRYNGWKIKPFLRSGFSPVLDFSDKNHSLDAVIGGGFMIGNRGQLEARYIQELTQSTGKRYSLFAASAAFYLW